MKKQEDYLSTSQWHRELITDPYQTIAEFFSACDLDHYRRCIKSMLMAACSNRVWRRKNPGELLWYLGLIESVINAAFLINKMDKQSPLSINMEDCFNPNLYCGRHVGYTEWDFFPRSLSFKEFADPYVAFRNFFKRMDLQEWKLQLKEIAEYALVESNILADGMETNMVPIYISLNKLVEAAHLIDVREVTHIGGHIKNRIKSNSHWISS